jgi:hypothetical protein
MPAGDLLGQPYQLEYDDELLGPDTAWGIDRMEGWDSLEDLRGGLVPLGADHGMIPGEMLAGGRRIIVTLFLEHEDGALTDLEIQDEIRRLKRITQIRRSTELPLVTMLRDGSKVFVNARPSGRSLPTDLDFTYGSPQALAEFIASDPTLYSPTLDETVIPIFVGSGGLTYDVTYDKDYGSSGSGLTTVVPNDGDWPTWPRFEISGPSSGTVQPLKIENVTTGEEIDFTADGGLTIPAGSTLVVETHPARRTVRFTDGASRWNTVAGTTWWPILAGGAALRFRAQGTTTGVTCTCQTRDAWM